MGVIGAGSSKVVPGEKVEGGGRIKEDGPEDDPDTPVITLAQRMRLLSGYYRITHTWSLRTHPISFLWGNLALTRLFTIIHRARVLERKNQDRACGRLRDGGCHWKVEGSSKGI